MPRIRLARPRLWLVFAAVVLAIVGTIWWKQAHWTPDVADYPLQGAWLSDGDVKVVPALPELGARFVYVTASLGAKGQNADFSATVEAARQAGLQAGAVHIYDPCRRADEQSANFVTLVARDADLLPPAVYLDKSGEDCPRRVRPAEVESELVVFLNQIESHAGMRAILAPSERFEEEYHFGSRAERELWLTRNWIAPGYAGRPWALWTANTDLRTGVVGGSVAWVVARP
ncbi:glycoside hydrolase family 25 protein [Croceicoccus naphthovorans]|uniref:Lysozyme n=2 Tax=Croceicoccus naphthovorans TaxID=1348774 RepID=A0A0G3XD40_9SPHN|nr:glycoside hydrolase family 25 protein [Croceicoccus naphthovorans]AKM09072.1 hypothetical protein AB433_02385 [Croceicoccus naphthovorans]